MTQPSFYEEEPLLRAEFDDSRNNLEPSSLVRSSAQKVWWLCAQGHSWEASVRSRTSGGRQCPFCSRKRAWPGETDFLTESPHLNEYWNPELNPGVDPTSITSGSDKKLKWQCREGHIFEKSVFAMKKTGCKYCSNNSLLAGFNDLKTRRPDLAREFDTEKNFPLLPQDFLYGSAKSVWWRCEEGHQFKAKISNRNFSNSKCIYCVGKKVWSGENDFETQFPHLAETWDHERNETSPSEVAVSSQKKFWWRCEKGHSWLMAPGERRTQNCAVCRGYQVWPGFNDLATTRPEILDRIDREKSPDEIEFKITGSSAKKIWWKCKIGHSYQRSPAVEAKQGCGICAGQIVLEGFNDLDSQAPDVAAHFDFHKNNKAPSEIYYRSRQNFWWICDRGHSWRTCPEFLKQGNWCPYCGKKKLLKGFNDLGTESPEIAVEWHPTKNGSLRPSDVLGGTHKYLWWLCKNGHSFRQTGKKRRAGQGCPSCSRTGFAPSKPAFLYYLEHPEMLSYKVGITAESSPGRLSLFREVGWVTLKLYRFEKGQDALDFESEFFDWLRKEMRIPPYLSSTETKRTGGWTETFSVDSISYEATLEKLKTLAAKYDGRDA